MCFCRDVMLGVPSKVVVFFLVCLFFRTNSLYFVWTLCRQCGWWMNFADFQVCSCHFFLFLWKLFCINLWTVYQAAYRWLEKIFLLFTSSSKRYGIGLQILMVQTHSNVAWRGEKKKADIIIGFDSYLLQNGLGTCYEENVLSKLQSPFT